MKGSLSKIVLTLSMFILLAAFLISCGIPNDIYPDITMKRVGATTFTNTYTSTTIEISVDSVYSQFNGVNLYYIIQPDSSDLLENLKNNPNDTTFLSVLNTYDFIPNEVTFKNSILTLNNCEDDLNPDLDITGCYQSNKLTNFSIEIQIDDSEKLLITYINPNTLNTEKKYIGRYNSDAFVVRSLIDIQKEYTGEVSNSGYTFYFFMGYVVQDYTGGKFETKLLYIGSY